MKICYVDESGSQSDDPCLIMVGLLVDATRLNRTQVEFAELFVYVKSLFPDGLKEIKGSKMIFGRDSWRKIAPDLRKGIASYLCEWIADRKHHILVSGVDRCKHPKACANSALPSFCRDAWLSAAMHIALQLQKNNQGEQKNKGRTFLVFDENKAKADDLSELLWQPPAWTDDYYAKSKKQERLDQLIDSSFTVKSHHAGLVQAADVYALIFRRYVEMSDFEMPEEWPGELALMQSYIEQLRPRLLARSMRWPAKTSSDAAKWFTSVAPDALLKLA